MWPIVGFVVALGCASGEDDESGWTFLPEGRIFAPLLADPRWPHFSVSYDRRYRRDVPRLKDTATISLGEHVLLVQHSSEDGTKIGLGLQPGVYGLFDLNTRSKDLVNADYRLAVPVDFRSGPVSLEAGVYHQSSHLGDEFVLRMQNQRVNFSLEAATLHASLDVSSLRLYAGFGRVIHSVPSGLDPGWAVQGIEWTPGAFSPGDAFAPVVAAHVEEREETDWRPTLSLRAGVEFLGPEKSRRRFQILLEYFRGQDPSGQFYRERIESLGLGVHFYF